MADKKTIEIKIVNDNAINSLTSNPRDFAQYAKYTADYAKSNTTAQLERTIAAFVAKLGTMSPNVINQTSSVGSIGYHMSRTQAVIDARIASRMNNPDFPTSSYRGYDESKRTAKQIKDAERYGIDLFRNPNMGNGFTTDYFRRQSWSNKFPNRNEPNILGLPAPESTSMAIWRGNSLATRGTGMRRSAYTADWILSGQNKSQSNTQSNRQGFTYTDAQYTESGANAGAQTIFDWINKIFSKAGSKIDSMMGKAGYESFNTKGKSVWNEGTGIAGRYSNPKNRALMGAAMTGSILNTLGEFGSNYGNYITSRANVTGSFAGNYYAGTANENYGNYLGGLVNSRNQFLQSQVRTGVKGATQVASAALFAMFPAEGIVGKLAVGAGLNSGAGGLSSLGAAEINKYLQVSGAAFQQKATNLGNASVASQYFGMSRWGGNSFQKNVIPADMTMNGKAIGLTMNNTLYNARDKPYFNQLSAFMQNSNVNPANLTNIDPNFTKLRSLGYTDTTSGARLGALSNVYGAITGNYNGAGGDLINQLAGGIGAYGNNYNLDTLQSSVRFQSIIGGNVSNQSWANDLAMRSQYFPEVGQAFNSATNAKFSQAIINETLWKAAKLPGSYQQIMSAQQYMTPETISYLQGISKKIATDPFSLKGRDALVAQIIGNRNEIIDVGIAGLLAKAKKTGSVADAKAAGDAQAASTYEQVMNTQNMTVNAQNVTIIDAMDKSGLDINNLLPYHYVNPTMSNMRGGIAKLAQTIRYGVVKPNTPTQKDVKKN